MLTKWRQYLMPKQRQAPIYFFWMTISVYTVLGFYLLYVAYATPLLGITLTPIHKKWVVEDVYFADWAGNVSIAKGDMILRVDDVPTNDVQSVQQYQSIFAANKLVIQHKNGHISTMSFHITANQKQFFTIFVIPMIHYILTLLVAIYLHYFKRNMPLLNLITLFQLMCSLAFISSSASSRNNIIGELVIGTCMISALVLLLHFLNNYYRLLHIKWPIIQHIGVLYVLPFFIFCLDFSKMIYPNITLSSSSVILFTFFLLFLFILFILLYGYYQSKLSQIKLLFLGFIVPFLPFVTLFVIPEIIGKKPLLSGEIAALFLLFIPFNFLFIQLSERLFDVEYHLSRIRYYGSLALVTAILITAIEWFIWHHHTSILKALNLFVMVFTIIFFLLVVKERIDFRQRKILFTTHGDSIHGVYTSIHRIGRATEKEQLLELFKQEVKEKLAIKHIAIDVDDQPNLLHQWAHLQLGEIHKYNHRYYLLLHHKPTLRIIVSLGSPTQKVHLKKEEIVWLELIAVYCDIFLNNLTRIEELVTEIQKIQTTKGNSIPWLDKIVWQIVEKEKKSMAQELHDTILQEQFHLARELEYFMETPHHASLTLEDIRDQLLDASYNLREYCENLHPPHLDAANLHVALRKFIRKVKIRANFTLHEQLEELNVTDSTLLLMIYRLVQELLNNAIKHSQATTVLLTLRNGTNHIELLYEDDGIGFELEEITPNLDSMGIRGMHERVKAFNGTIDIIAHPNNGIKMTIQLPFDAIIASSASESYQK